mgnify:CR=1 FL=1
MGTDDYLFCFSSFKKDERRNTSDPESGRGFLIFSYIHLHHLYSTLILVNELSNHRRHRFAGFTPLGPEFDHHRHIGIDDDLIDG